MIETPDVTFQAPADNFNPVDDDRHFPGLQSYFGDFPATWQQLKSTENKNGKVNVSFVCYDSGFPPQQPTLTVEFGYATHGFWVVG